MISAGGDPAVAARSPMNGLMLAFAFTLPYHVMRTADASGVCVHVLGDGASRGLRMSRHCRLYHETQFADDPEALLDEIGELVRRYAIDVIFPSDDVSTRLLAALAGRLPVRTTPLPDLATFDLLNDKWNFTRFCRQNGVRAPEGWVFDRIGELHRALDCGEVTLPITLKPTNRSGGIGVIHVRHQSELALIDRIDYRPILAQRHIVGETIGISVLCDRGKVVAHAAQRRDAVRFQLFANADLFDNVSRLAALTGYHGPANFDAVVADADEFSYIVECNPRFWYTIYLSMIAGLNFVELALAAPCCPTHLSTIDNAEFRLSLRRILSRPWRANRLDWKFLSYCLSDPIPFLLQRTRSYDDSDVAVAVDAMAAGEPALSPAAPRLALG
jgi:biotin carboxylase